MNKLKILYISSFAKKDCGVASYTQDLIASIKKADPSVLFDVIAAETLPNEKVSSAAVKYYLKSPENYGKAAKLINDSNCNIVHIQHEFGLFAGQDGNKIVALASKIKKPIIITFHTVLSDPDSSKKEIVTSLSKVASKIIVMAVSATNNLTRVYTVNRQKILELPHGVPEMAFDFQGKAKKKITLVDHQTLMTFGLLNPGKGIEYAIRALALTSGKYPKIKMLVIGKTHPKIVINEGEKYRQFLHSEVERLSLQNNVVFIDKYLSTKELLVFLQATDIYITPYLEPQQTTSGTLAYALGAGKPCISTPYIYAKEVLSKERGYIVPFRDEKSIAEKILYLFDHPEIREQMALNAYRFSRNMTWKTVGQLHLDSYRQLLDREE